MIQGFDVSHWQGLVDFKHHASSGKYFVFAKATESIGNTDRRFAHNRMASKQAGLLFGAYHFFHPADDLEAQVKHFESVVGKLQPGELPCALDWETNDGNKIGIGAQKLRALQFVQEVEKLSGKTPFIYGSGGWLKQYGDMSMFSKYPFWIADYSRPQGQPRLPIGIHQAIIHQYSSNTGFDLDVFMGSLDQLKSLA